MKLQSWNRVSVIAGLGVAASLAAVGCGGSDQSDLTGSAGPGGGAGAGGGATGGSAQGGKGGGTGGSAGAPVGKGGSSGGTGARKLGEPAEPERAAAAGGNARKFRSSA